MTSDFQIAVIGLGYVGLPVALALAKKHDRVMGFDVNVDRVAELSRGIDHTNETDTDDLKATRLKFTANPEDIAGCNFYIVCVPTPIDGNRQPDLTPVIKASQTVGKVLTSGDVIVYESTVYPGVTEDICGPLLEKFSGLKQGKDFKLGYSPERINPGDHEHSIHRVVKVVAGEDAETLEKVAAVYASIVEVGVHRAPSIKVAESAKVIENIQRDLNIALMNELSIIFDRLDIRTADVLAAARTKWNFIPFTPGLVGGHCIGVDPYYLTAKAQQVGYDPQVILSGRRINDGMGTHIAQKLIRLLIQRDKKVKGAAVGILGITFKENVPDLRNSRVPDIIKELHSYGIEPVLHDILADAGEAHAEYGVHLQPDLSKFKNLDALILAVPHRAYLAEGPDKILSLLGEDGIFIDVKSAFSSQDIPTPRIYWSL
jgi:UDP-N-acetyl-D-galactosamine dehydrogenase